VEDAVDLGEEEVVAVVDLVVVEDLVVAAEEV
jgi:hypothetical protein